LKTLIKFSFSRFAESYDKEADLQKKAAEILINYAGNIEGNILDIGCGTGFISRISEWKGITGIDISYEMARYYKKFNERALTADMENMPLKDNSFDVVVSNFSIHWTDIENTILETRRVLKPKGSFIFNIPVNGSLKFVEKILGMTQFDFPSISKILELLNKYKFEVSDYKILNMEKEFDDGYHLLMHLHKTGVAINTGKKSLKEKRQIVRKFKEHKEPSVLNFRLLFVKSFLNDK